ncbi:hypothetical protein SDC9_94572 [bioreactor metagenome]|uniref:Uncharacterized protein n=1 Tax=bioreactor metagenome TaxID=1076179 RepID=A0A645A6F0_9ZZZZ
MCSAFGVANFNVHAKICAHVKWRVNVDQLQPAVLLDLFAQRAVLEAGKDQFVIPPDQFVGPARFLAAAFIKQIQLHGRIGLLLRARLVHLLDHLKGQHNVGHFVGLAIPDQLNFAFVIKQHKTVFIREGFIRFDQLQYLAFFIFGQFHSPVLS